MKDCKFKVGQFWRDNRGFVYQVSSINSVEVVFVDSCGAKYLHNLDGTYISNCDYKFTVTTQVFGWDCGGLSTGTDCTGTESRVCQDIAERQKLGVSKYGGTVESELNDKLESLQHAYEEALNLAVYLKRTIELIEAEITNTGKRNERHNKS